MVGAEGGVVYSAGGSLADGWTGGSWLKEASGSAVASCPWPAESEAEGVGSPLSSTANPAGSMAFTLPAPGSTMSRRSPAGSPADVRPPAFTRASTASEGPTHAGSVPPRAAPRSPWPLSPSSRSHGDHCPVPMSRVRTSTLPVTRAPGSVHVMPSMLNGSAS
ncbi:hypothetical protein SAMN05216483_0568 [Streptomyces sp. 2131.1]|nr:hypothetical protein SAMN05216483_0568 [Streptomyces sp. 2131.1]